MAVTVISAVFGNSLKNKFSKQYLKNQSDNLSFNLLGNALVIVILVFAGGAVKVSGYTFRLAVGMGIFNLLAGLLFSLSLANGPMALTTLIQLGISLVLSALIGPVFWNEGISSWQFAGIGFLLVSMVLTSNARVDRNITFKWLFLTVLGGVANSLLGLFQKLLTTSEYAGEQMGFLFYSFILCTLSNVIWLMFSKKKEPVTYRLSGSVLVFAIICGVTMALQHIINLRLVGVLPTVVFFPICTGLRILLTALVGIIIFKEKLSKRQLAGFIIGFAALFMVAGIFG